MLNKTDPYVWIKVVGNPTKKTTTIMGSLNPVFKKDNCFMFTGGVGTWVEVICMDWDPLSNDDVVIKVGRLIDADIKRLCDLYSYLAKLSFCQFSSYRVPSS